MQFSRVIGKIDPKLVKKAEEVLSKIFLEMATKYDNKHIGSGLGGEPFQFSLMFPAQHICTLNMPTAATNGRAFFWNPKYVIKQSKIGLRLLFGHESWHAIYMHPSRRGSRNPKLWNIAVDYIVDFNCMEDLRLRGFDAAEYFRKYMGRYMTLDQFVEQIKDPFEYSKKLRGLGEEDIDPNSSPANDQEGSLPAPGEDRELTPKEIEELEKREKKIKYYYADPNLPEDMRRPEAIYDMLYALLPKCPKCGRLGVYKQPDSGKKGKKNKGQQGQGDDKNGGKKGQKGQQPGNQPGGQQPGNQPGGQQPGNQPGDGHDHGEDGSPCDCGDCGNGQCGCGDQDGQGQGQGQGQPGGQGQGQSGQGSQPGQGQGQGGGCCCGDGDGPCDECGGGIDIFGLGGTVDDHMDSEETKEKMAKKISDAMESARKMAGHIPAGLEEELGLLTAPTIRWSDVIRSRILKTRQGGGRNDWTRFRTRPLFTGLLIPKKKDYVCNAGVLLDTSGSMSRDDMSYGISQLQSLDERNELTICFADSTIYWDKAVKVKKLKADELSKLRPIGRGGTVWAEFFSDYEKHIGKCDFLIIISDLYLDDVDIASAIDPSIPVYWLCTSNNTSFKAPFGKIMYLRG